MPAFREAFFFGKTGSFKLNECSPANLRNQLLFISKADRRIYTLRRRRSGLAEVRELVFRQPGTDGD